MHLTAQVERKAGNQSQLDDEDESLEDESDQLDDLLDDESSSHDLDEASSQDELIDEDLVGSS